MKSVERMDEFFDTVSYVGEVQPWRDLEDLATSEDEPHDPVLVPSRAKRRDLIGTETSGNYGHEGRPGQVGGSAKGSGAVPSGYGVGHPDRARILTAFTQTFTEAESYNETHFILPDGTRLSHGEDTHTEGAEKAGVAMRDALRAGVMRFTPSGGEIGAPMTEAQAQHLVDAMAFSGRSWLSVDVSYPTGKFRDDGKALEDWDNKMFNEHATADGVRHWTNGHFPRVLSRGQQQEWVRLYGGSVSADLRAYLLYGTSESGNYGHKGRPGEVGGSAPDGVDNDERSPYAVAEGAPRGGEGQQALFEYAPEAGTEGALKVEAEKAISTLDAMLPEAVQNADFGGVEVQEWDELELHDQNAIKAKWADEEKSSEYVEEAGQEAANEYIKDNLTPDAIFERAVKGDALRVLLEDHGIDPQSLTFKSQPSIEDGMPVLSLDWDELRDKYGIGLAPDDPRLAPIEGEFSRQARWASRDIQSELAASDGYTEAVTEAEDKIMRREWSQMDDSQRFKIAQAQGAVPSNPVEHEPPGVWKFDGDMHDEDYVQTRAVSLELAHQRSANLMIERGLLPKGPSLFRPEPDADAARKLTETVGEEFWNAWKSSSTSPLGVGMQMVVAEEMGVHNSPHISDQQKGFARAAMARAFTTADEQEHHSSYPGGDIALEKLGMERAKAYVRAQWETTQYVMKQAGVHEVNLYRGIILTKDEIIAARDPSVTPPNPDTERFRLVTGPLPNLHLLQNSVASSTTKPGVANTWNGIGEKTLGDPNNRRAVIRFKAPVTALFSLPVFGENIHEESEVVIMGTKGLQWDAHERIAPTFESKPLAQMPTTGEVTIVEPEVKGLRVTWDLADTKPKAVVVDLSRNVDGHWLVDWRRHKDRPLPKKRVVPSPAKRTSDALAKVIVEGMKQGMLPTMRKLSYRDKLPFLLGNEHSGNYGHKGRPGEVGGSAPGDGGGGEHEYKKADGTVIRFLSQPPQALDPKKLKRVLGLSPDEVNAMAAQMANRVPGEVEIRVRTQHSDGQDRVTIKMTTMEGVEILQVFDRRNDQLVNTLEFMAIPEDLQGQGVSKHILEDTVKAYERIGVDQIRLHANIDVGSYAWAKFGFVADSPRKLATDIVKRLNEPFPPPGRPSFAMMKPEEKARLLKVIEDHKDDPKLPWHIASTVSGAMEVGKELLMNKHWYGHLDLHDPEQRKKFDSYVMSKSRPRPKES